MSDLFRIWSLSGGNPKVSSAVTFAAGGATHDLVAAVTGKRIVPVWMYIGETGITSEISEIQVEAKTSGDLVFKTGINGKYCQSPVVRFRGIASEVLDVGEALQGVVSGNAVNVFYLTLGYYLI